MKTRGSALLIALLIVTLTSAIGFGLTRIGLMQTRLQNTSSSLGKAYQAAEAGLELGLAQYRLDPGGEISWQRSGPSGNTNPVVPPGVTYPNAIQSTPARYSLDNNLLVDGNQSVTNNDQQFDLLMYHHTYSIGDDSCFETANLSDAGCGTIENPLGVLNPGENYTLTIPNQDGLKMFLRAKEEGAVCAAGSPATLVVNAFNSLGGDGQTFTSQQVIDFCKEVESANNVSGTGGDPYALSLPISTKKVSLTYYAAAGQLTFALLANGGGLYNDNSRRLPFDSGVTTIDVTGYAGGTSRRLKATIDRRTNKLLGVFSYAVYGESFAPAP